MASEEYAIRFNADELKAIAAIVAAHQGEDAMRPLVRDGVILAMKSTHIDALLSYIEPELARANEQVRSAEEKARWVQMTRIADRLVNARLQ